MTPHPVPTWLSGGAEPVFAVHHPADPDAPAGGPVLIVPPWGWHEVASYRSRRTWAGHLADRGHDVLRIDLPGTGDSGGTAATAGLVAASSEAVIRAVDWLLDRSGAASATAIGLGVGGLVIADAIAAGARIDGLVAWATPADGRAEVRRQRAFSRMQDGRWSLTEPEPAALPDGWLETNGFVLSAETIAALGRLRLPGESVGSLARALVLDADGVASSAPIAAGLRAAGVDVTVADGPGWEAMTVHPQFDAPPAAVFGIVDAWLAAPEPSTAPAHAAIQAEGDRRDGASGTSGTASLLVDGVRIRETAIVLPTAEGRLFAILSEPADARPAPVAALFLNAGAVRRIGPDRIWVETSRRWAAHGIPTLRVDLDGIGDSDGEAARYRDVGAFYARTQLADEIRALSDELLERTGAEHLVLAGLCAGGYWAFHGADRDPRVVAAYLLNPGALAWRTDLVRDRNARRLRRLADPVWWGRLARGQVRWARIRAVARAAFGRAVESAGGGLRARPHEVAPPGLVEGLRPPVEVLAGLEARAVRLVVAFSADEALHAELVADGFLDHLARARNVELASLPGRDHTLRPIAAQLAAHDLLDRSIAGDLARLGVPGWTAAPPAAVESSVAPLPLEAPAPEPGAAEPLAVEPLAAEPVGAS